MKLLIAENIRPMLMNQAYSNVPGKGRRKTGEYKRFITDLHLRLKSYEDKKKEFLEYLNVGKFSLATILKIYVPMDRFYTVKGDISKNKGDCGNYRKCVQDVIFDWIGIDDKYSIHETNIQIEDDQGLWGFSFEIEIEAR